MKERLLKLAIKLEKRADRNMVQAIEHKACGELAASINAGERAEAFINIALEIRECVR
jgi:hypothetical protein